MSTTHELLDSLPQKGTVEWIGLAPASRLPIQPVQQVLAEVGTGLAGDHHSTHRPGGKRQVTLIQAEHFPVIGALLDIPPPAPSELRRNLVVRGINLQALKSRQFQIGSAILEGTGDCVPCSLMESTLGPGGFNAMRGHGGITARVIQAGVICVGDQVSLISGSPVSEETAR